MLLKTVTLFFFCLAVMTNLFSQSSSDTTWLNLKQVVDLARGKSIASKQASTLKETRYWEWRTYKSNYQPQLLLSGNLPGYNKTFTEVLQPNGSIEFRPIHNNNS